MNFNDYKRNRIGTILHDCEMKDSNTKYISVKELDKIIADEMRMIREKEEKEKKKPSARLCLYLLSNLSNYI